jgi:hypothetical protein
MVIDGDATLMGSMNWTNAAARNSDDLNLASATGREATLNPEESRERVWILSAARAGCDRFGQRLRFIRNCDLAFCDKFGR